MGIPLPNTDLSAAIVGSSGSIDLTRVGVGAGGVSANPSTLNKLANLFLFNESGCLLTITFAQTGNGFKLPSGGWTITPLPMGEYKINWSVDFLLGGAPISLLVGTYYAPGEPIPSGFALGNSPIGGNVSTSGGGGIASQLINTGNPASGTAIIDIQESGATGPQVFADNQGNFYIQQYVASVLTTLLRTIAGQPSGQANVLLGDTSHIVQSNGQLNPNSGIHATAFGTLPATNVSNQFDGSSVGGSAVMDININAVNGNGIISGPQASSLGAWTCFYASGDLSGPSSGVAFGVNGLFSKGFDASGIAGTPPQIILNWNYGQILNSNTEQIIQSTNLTNLRLNVPSGQIVNIDVNNVPIVQVAGASVQVNQPLFPYKGLNASGFNTSVNGSVAGTLTAYGLYQGPVKIIVLIASGFNSTQIDLALPFTFSNYCDFWAGGCGPSGSGGLNLLSGGSAQTLSVISTIAATGGSVSGQTGIWSFTQGAATTGFDTIRALSTAGNVRNYVCHFIGT